MLWREFFVAFPPPPGTERKDWHKLTSPEHLRFFTDRGCVPTAIAMPAGALTLWNSKTFHYGREPLATRRRPTTRLVVYVCMVPCPPLREPATAKLLAQRLAALRDGRTTSHWPHKVTLLLDMLLCERVSVSASASASAVRLLVASATACTPT